MGRTLLGVTENLREFLVSTKNKFQERSIVCECAIKKTPANKKTCSRMDRFQSVSDFWQLVLFAKQTDAECFLGLSLRGITLNAIDLTTSSSFKISRFHLNWLNIFHSNQHNILKLLIIILEIKFLSRFL